MLRLDQLAPTMGVESWIIMASGAFLLSLCFLVSFIAADAWMSRQPISLRSICSSVLELYESRGEITDNEKWQQELSRLRNDCAVALSTKNIARLALGSALLRNGFRGLCDRVIGHWLAHGFCNLSMSHESRERTGLV